jgi:hypothetical protein
VIGTKCHTQTNLPELEEEGSIWLQPQAFLDEEGTRVARVEGGKACGEGGSIAG